MKKIAKKNYRMFRREIYLIGIDTDGQKVFLEEPSWDCGWYWGFGYLETYTNNRAITMSRDIQSHSHFNNFEADCSLNDYHDLESCVLDYEGLLTLKYLMKQAINLGNEARKTKSREFENLTEIHSLIIEMLKP